MLCTYLPIIRIVRSAKFPNRSTSKSRIPKLNGFTWHGGQLDFILEMDMLFEICHTEIRKWSMKQHIRHFNFLNKIQSDHPVHCVLLRCAKAAEGETYRRSCRLSLLTRSLQKVVSRTLGDERRVARHHHRRWVGVRFGIFVLLLLKQLNKNRSSGKLILGD